MQIDSHQHFWRYRASEYPWMTDDLAALRRDYLPADLKPLLDEAGFDGTVAVQARQSLAETDWLLELADAHPSIKGVVGWVDLCAPNLRKQLQAYRRRRKLIGVRHVLQDEPDDNFMLKPEFRRGIGELREFGLTYDLLIYPRHLPNALKLVQEFPRQPFVLDHLGKPEIRSNQISPWREDLQRLADRPNVHCKLSGMVTEAKWKQWEAADIHRYIHIALDCFGWKRLMIGSDWPVCTVAGEYHATLQIVIGYLRQFPEKTRAAILGENCARFYGISK